MVANLRNELRAYYNERNVGNQSQSIDNSTHVDSGVKRGSPSGQEMSGVIDQTPVRKETVAASTQNATPDTTSWNVVNSPEAEWVENDDGETLTRLMK